VATPLGLSPDGTDGIALCHRWPEPVDPEPDNPTRALVHHNEDPMGFESKGLTPEHIDTPQTVFRLTDE
jgi:hypothetical protein